MRKPLFGCNALLILVAAFFVSCGEQSVLSRQTARATTVDVDEFDDGILRITENARNTLNIFFRHLNTAEAGEGYFSVKYAFLVDTESGISAEQIWIDNITFRNGRYYGTVASTPVYLAGIRRGDTINFNVDLITDWMFTRNGRIVGGHSIRHLLEQIPEGYRTAGQRRTLQMFE